MHSVLISIIIMINRTQNPLEANYNFRVNSRQQGFTDDGVRIWMIHQHFQVSHTSSKPPNSSKNIMDKQVRATVIVKVNTVPIANDRFNTRTVYMIVFLRHFRD